MHGPRASGGVQRLLGVVATAALMMAVAGAAHCQPASPVVPDAGASLDEGTCPTNPDVDGDGHTRLACGGDDCDDSNRSIHPYAVETCNGIDDDCNGVADDATATDGWCGDPSRAVANATTICTGGRCTVGTCDPHFVDCGGSPGCETPADDSNCGACGRVCPHGGCVSAECPNDYVQIEVAAAVTCARRGNGAVDCWGDNTHGQLGIGTTDISRTRPTPVSGLADAIGLACDSHGYCCAPRRSGAVACWGHRLLQDDMAPVEVGGYVDARLVWTHAPDLHSLEPGGAAIWVVRRDSLDRVDESAGGWTITTLVPSGLADVSELSVGHGGLFSPTERPLYPCLLRGAGGITCVGASNMLTDVNGLGPVTHISCSDGTCYGSGRDGSIADWWLTATTGMPFLASTMPSGVARWGWAADDGQPLDLSFSGVVQLEGYFLPPVSLPAAVDVSGTIRSDHACALLRGGSAVCWGQNAFGQLGDGTTTPSTSVAVTVAGS